MTFLRSLYHFCLACIGAGIYRFPSKKLVVIAVTGTKGKSSTTEMINAIFEHAGKKTAVLNSIRIKIGSESTPNTMRMSMPGRFFIESFLARAVGARIDVAILEMTSEGARQHRHRGISLDALVFTNLAPEHIESHGSFEAYADAKFQIGLQLARSHKRPRVIVANAEDNQSARYLALPVEKKRTFSIRNTPHAANENGGHFTYNGARVTITMPGEFSIENALAAATLADAFGISTPTIAQALETITIIPGRAEKIEAGQDFAVVVDYAHTPESLKALYEAYANTRKICVLGSTGGGRDKWKRPVMGKIASEYCDTIILTNEDPYDEDPRTIIEELASQMKSKPEVIVDRRQAIARGIARATALRQAQTNKNDCAVLITGKGTDPTIQGPRHTSIPWNDAQVAREEIAKAIGKKTV